MSVKTSDWAMATALPGVFFGRDDDGNKQIPLSIVQAYIQQIIAQTASNADGAVNFRGVWNATFDYAPNDLVSYNSKVYLMIATSVHLSSTPPDQDPTNWLCLYGQQVLATDLNIAPDASYFYCQGALNAPDSDPTGFGFTLYHGTGFAVQFFWNTAADTMYTRSLDTNWSPWAVMATTFQRVNVPGGEGTGTIYASPVNQGEFQSTITVATQLNIAGWANITGKVQRFRWEITNGGAFPTTWGPFNNLNWIKSDGTITTDFTQLGIVWNPSGPNFFEFWTRDGGNTVYGRALTS